MPTVDFKEDTYSSSEVLPSANDLDPYRSQAKNED
jgi:hypothetical protein